MVIASYVIYNVIKLDGVANVDIFSEWATSDRVPDEDETTLDDDEVYTPNIAHEGAS